MALMLRRHNGHYELSGVNGTYRFAEQALMSRVINYLARQAQRSRQRQQQGEPHQPFFVYYAPRAIHTYVVATWTHTCMQRCCSYCSAHVHVNNHR
jgi:hypothetical protein